jgi:hypothetical protein
MFFGTARRSIWHVKGPSRGPISISSNLVGDDDIFLGQHLPVPTNILFVIQSSLERKTLFIFYSFETPNHFILRIVLLSSVTNLRYHHCRRSGETHRNINIDDTLDDRTNIPYTSWPTPAPSKALSSSFSQ